MCQIVTCQMSPVSCHMSHEHNKSQTVKARVQKFSEKVQLPPAVMCHISCVTCHMSHVTCHMSHFTCHMSHVTCHMSFVMCPMISFCKGMKLVSVGFDINGKGSKKANFAAIKLFETKKENKFQQAKRGLR